MPRDIHELADVRYYLMDVRQRMDAIIMEGTTSPSRALIEEVVNIQEEYMVSKWWILPHLLNMLIPSRTTWIDTLLREALFWPRHCTRSIVVCDILQPEIQSSQLLTLASSLGPSLDPTIPHPFVLALHTSLSVNSSTCSP
jgi:hypothetical protein